jgi:hypothetical protein
MAVSTTAASKQYVGNNSAVTPYPTEFPFHDATDVRVQVEDADGIVTELEYGTDYTVTGAGDPDGGDVVTDQAWDNTHTVTLIRQVPLTQLLDLVYNDRFPSENAERALDKLTFIVQQLAGNVAVGDRSIRFPYSEPEDNNTVLPTPVLRRDSVIYFDATTGEMTTKTLDELATIFESATVTLTGDNIFEGNNTFSGDNTFDGAVDFNGLVTFGGQVEFTVETLTDAASIAWDASLGNMAQVTLGGNRTLANPTNMKAGTYLLRVTQDGTGSRTLAYGVNFKFPGGIAPTLSTAAGAIDILTFVSFGGTDLYLAEQKAFA